MLATWVLTDVRIHVAFLMKARWHSLPCLQSLHPLHDHKQAVSCLNNLARKCSITIFLVCNNIFGQDLRALPHRESGAAVSDSTTTCWKICTRRSSRCTRNIGLSSLLSYQQIGRARLKTVRHPIRNVVPGFEQSLTSNSDANSGHNNITFGLSTRVHNIESLL